MIASDFITLALKDITSIGEGDTPTAEEVNDGLAILNQMLENWSLIGIYVATIANGADDCNFPTGYDEPIRYNLAARLASAFGKQVPQAIAVLAVESFANLKRSINPFMVTVPVDPSLRPRLSQGWYYLTDGTAAQQG